MRLITKALIVAALLVAADKICFQGRLSNQLLDQANSFGTNFQWQMATWLHKFSLSAILQALPPTPLQFHSTLC